MRKADYLKIAFPWRWDQAIFGGRYTRHPCPACKLKNVSMQQQQQQRFCLREAARAARVMRKIHRQLKVSDFAHTGEFRKRSRACSAYRDATVRCRGVLPESALVGVAANGSVWCVISKTDPPTSNNRTRTWSRQQTQNYSDRVMKLRLFGHAAEHHALPQIARKPRYRCLRKAICLKSFANHCHHAEMASRWSFRTYNTDRPGLLCTTH